MTRVDSFARSVVFAAMVATASLPWMLVAAPLLGGSTARAMYLAFAALAYVMSLMRARQPRWIALAVVSCAVAAVMAHSVTELAMMLGVVIGVFRGGYLHRADGPRTLLREVVLIGGGLVFASALATTLLPATATGLWGFFLVQSIFFLGAPSRFPDRERGDAFEAAYRRAEEMLARAHS